MQNPAAGSPGALHTAHTRTCSLGTQPQLRMPWVVIDGNRLAVGWNERQEGMADDAPAYRGISTFVFDDDGLIASYEGMFDTAAVASPVGAS